MKTARRSPAVIDGKLQHVSASQIKTYLECPRIWYKQKVMGEEFSPTKAMQLGTKVHLLMEEMAKEEGEPSINPDSLNETVLSSVHLARGLVPPGGLAEVPIKLEISGIPVHGFIDYYLRGSVPKVIDWKTTSDFRYAKTHTDVAQDIQSVIYTRWAMDDCQAKEAAIAFVYIHTREPGAKIVPAMISRADTDREWTRLTSIVDLIKVTAGQKEDEVPCVCGRCRVMPMKAIKFSLYIDCIPSGEYTRLESVLAELTAKETKSLKYTKAAGQDFRHVPYGEGPGMLAAALRANPPSGKVVATRGGLSDVAIEALSGLTDDITVGI